MSTKLFLTRLSGFFYTIFLISILSFVNCANDEAYSILSENKQQAIESFAEKIKINIETDNVGGLAVGIVGAEGLIWSNGFGFADTESKTKAAPDHIFRIGSITKSFTAVLMMSLVDKGIVSLDDPVSKYLPEVKNLKDRPAGAEPITLRLLASHSAGLDREPKLRSAFSGPVDEWAEKTIESIGYTSFIAMPGEEYHYSNIGYAILGLALSRAADKPFIELIDEHILNPLKMDDSFLVLGHQHLPRVASGYALMRDGTIDSDQPYEEHGGRGYKMPNGAMYSTLKDLAVYMNFISSAVNNDLLTENSLHELVRPHSPGGEYGFGFKLYEAEDGLKTIGHSGSVAGYSAFILYEPNTKLGVVMLRNYKGGLIELEKSSKELLRTLLDK